MRNAAYGERGQAERRKTGMNAGVALYRYEASHWRQLAQSATTVQVKNALLQRARDCERSAAALEAYTLLPWEGAA